MILAAKNINKSWGADPILRDITFTIEEGDRIGIVGGNGAGKTTLLNVIAGDMTRESGDIFMAKETTIGYLRQKNDFDENSTVQDEVEKIHEKYHIMEQEIRELTEKVAELGETAPESSQLESALHRLSELQEKYESSGGFTYKSVAKGILDSMAIPEEYYEKIIGTLSGGEKTRLSLALLLIKKPDILMLDEPTNHLDIGTLKWLEQYIRSYTGTVISVSHDRYFLDRTVNRIFEIQNRRLREYKGNYSEYVQKRKKVRESEEKAWLHQQEEINRQEDMIRRYKERGTEKLAKRAKSREKRLSKVERLEKPMSEPDNIKFSFHQNYKSGNDVLSGENISKSFGQGENKTELFRGITFDIKRGERICIVGHNGCGKTTFLKILREELKPTEGFLKIGHNVDMGYYDQEQKMLSTDKTVIDEVHDTYNLYTDGEIRNILARFGFRGEDVFLRTGSLSGGEKARLSLLKLMMQGSNTLILDEPTNHLDIGSKEMIEEAIQGYPGTIIAVSHDRYFLNRVPDRIFEMSRTGFVEYAGNYDYYVEKKESVDSGKSYIRDLKKVTGPGADAKEEPEMSAAERRKIQKEKEAQERRLRRRRESLEKKIEELETAKTELQEEMCLEENINDYEKLAKLSEKTDGISEELEALYEEWMEL